MANINVGKDFLTLDTHVDRNPGKDAESFYSSVWPSYQHMEWTKFNGSIFNKPENLVTAIEQSSVRSEESTEHSGFEYFDSTGNLVGEYGIYGSDVAIYREYGSYEHPTHGTMNEVTSYIESDLRDTTRQVYTATSEDGTYSLELQDNDGDNIPDIMEQTQILYGDTTIQKELYLTAADKSEIAAAIQNGTEYKPRANKPKDETTTDKFIITSGAGGRNENKYIDFDGNGTLDKFVSTEKDENGTVRHEQIWLPLQFTENWYRYDGSIEREVTTINDANGDVTHYFAKNYDENGKVASSQTSEYTYDELNGLVTEKTVYINADGTRCTENKIYNQSNGNLIDSETLSYSADGKLVSKMIVYTREDSSKYLYRYTEYDANGEELLYEASGLNY